MTAATELERYMLTLINEERTSRGLDPVQLELNLNESSEDHSQWMLRDDVFSHTGAGGSNAGGRMRDAGFDFSGSWGWAENIAYQSERGPAGYQDDVANLHQALMNSAGHRANILNGSYDYVGIGVEIGDYRGLDVVMVTQNFARTGGQVDLDRGTAPGTPVVPPEEAPAGPPIVNRAPELSVDDLSVGRKGAARWAELEPAVTAVDPDHDAILFYQVRDTRGGSNFWLDDDRLSSGTVFEAADLDALHVLGDQRSGTQTLEMRASDGADWGDWAAFQLTTEAGGWLM